MNRPLGSMIIPFQQFCMCLPLYHIMTTLQIILRLPTCLLSGKDQYGISFEQVPLLRMCYWNTKD